MLDVPTCNRCGRCCHYQQGTTWRKCRFLVIQGRRSSCRIWGNPDRVGTEIAPGQYCNRIEDIPNTYVGCPFNEGKPLVLVTIKPYLDK